MAKLMVEIDIPNRSYERLTDELIHNPIVGDSGWFSEEDGGVGNVVVDEAYLKRSKSDDCFYVFKLIGVRP